MENSLWILPTGLVIGIVIGAAGYAAFQFWRLWKYARSR